MRRLILPLTALLLAGASTFAVRTWLDAPRRAPASQQAAPMPSKPQKAVLVAARDLPVGTFVDADKVRWQDWPDVATPDSYLIRGEDEAADLTGAVLRRSVAMGDPLTTGSVVKPGDRGFLAAVLDPGMRAVSVPVDEASSNAGLIFPGDRVDLILTQALEADGEAPGTRRVSETVLWDVRVIAMGRRLTTENGEEGAPGTQVRTATLETNPADAEKVALLTDLGRLSLSLRSLATQTGVAERPATAARSTWDTDVSPALRPKNQPRSVLSVVRGEKTEIISIRRGADS
jgi:pilus assembly protein CpaB